MKIAQNIIFILLVMFFISCSLREEKILGEWRNSKNDITWFIFENGGVFEYFNPIMPYSIVDDTLKINGKSFGDSNNIQRYLATYKILKLTDDSLIVDPIYSDHSHILKFKRFTEYSKMKFDGLSLTEKNCLECTPQVSIKITPNWECIVNGKRKGTIPTEYQNHIRNSISLLDSGKYISMLSNPIFYELIIYSDVNVKIIVDPSSETPSDVLRAVNLIHSICISESL